MNMKQFESVLPKVAKIFDTAGVEYMLSGSGAGKMWGLTRMPGDLDFYIFERDYDKMAKAMKPYVVQARHRYRDSFFDEELMACVIDGVVMDICVIDGGYYSSFVTNRIQPVMDFYKPVRKKLGGYHINIQDLPTLIAYKDANRSYFACHQGADVKELRGIQKKLSAAKKGKK